MNTLLCVVNFPANTGYAWDFIERLYAGIADRLVAHGAITLVAYPAIASPPATLAGSAAQPITLDASLATWTSLRATARLIRQARVRIVYFTDRPAVHPAYLVLRAAGARWIVVHDHTSGARTRPRGLKRVLKWLYARMPGLCADVVIGVSDYVARRHLEVGMTPRERVVRVWNGIPVGPSAGPPDRLAHGLFGLSLDRPVIACACRATPQKGVAYLLRAFDLVARDPRYRERRPVLLYIGAGPQFPELSAMREALCAREHIILAGYRPDAARLVQSADLCVVPSVWEEACCLGVLEPMAAGRPVVATRVGGNPELIVPNVTGLLVPPSDEAALAKAIGALLDDPAWAARLGQAARRRVLEHFSPQRQLAALTATVERGFADRAASRQLAVSPEPAERASRMT